MDISSDKQYPEYLKLQTQDFVNAYFHQEL